MRVKPWVVACCCDFAHNELNPWAWGCTCEEFDSCWAYSCRVLFRPHRDLFGVCWFHRAEYSMCGWHREVLWRGKVHVPVTTCSIDALTNSVPHVTGVLFATGDAFVESWPIDQCEWVHSTSKLLKELLRWTLFAGLLHWGYCFVPLDMDSQRGFDSEVCWSGPGIFEVTSNEYCVSDFQVEVWTNLGKSFATFCNLSPGAILGTSKAGGLSRQIEV